ncbi:MAG: PrsW family glutamic-type intramembrane protease [Patescibacteria group bacterium]
MAPALFIAILGGVVPALVWLAFWLLEDRCKPEPKRYIFLSFLAGMAAVLPALIIERAMIPHLSGSTLLFGWAATEEILKLLAVCVAALWWAFYDEPLDAVIYTVTVALGFSAMENALFLMTPIMEGDVLRSIITGDLRFIGATLLHTLASATVGVSLALAYYRPAAMRRAAVLIGLILAIVLHTLFNFFILGAGGGSTFWVFLIIWAGIVSVLFALERVKRPANYC